MSERPEATVIRRKVWRVARLRCVKRMTLENVFAATRTRSPTESCDILTEFPVGRVTSAGAGKQAEPVSSEVGDVSCVPGVLSSMDGLGSVSGLEAGLPPAPGAFGETELSGLIELLGIDEGCGVSVASGPSSSSVGSAVASGPDGESLLGEVSGTVTIAGGPLDGEG